jgi:hypothetical protein
MAIRKRVARVALAALLINVAAGGRADSAASWWDARDATGDWNGSRRWLDERGVHIDLDYTADEFIGAGARSPGVVTGYRGTSISCSTWTRSDSRSGPGGLSWFTRRPVTGAALRRRYRQG